jgi:hypothetical protein
VLLPELKIVVTMYLEQGMPVDETEQKTGVSSHMISQEEVDRLYSLF